MLLRTYYSLMEAPLATTQLEAPLAVSLSKRNRTYFVRHNTSGFDFGFASSTHKRLQWLSWKYHPLLRGSATRGVILHYKSHLLCMTQHEWLHFGFACALHKPAHSSMLLWKYHSLEAPLAADWTLATAQRVHAFYHNAATHTKVLAQLAYGAVVVTLRSCRNLCRLRSSWALHQACSGRRRRCGRLLAGGPTEPLGCKADGTTSGGSARAARLRRWPSAHDTASCRHSCGDCARAGCWLSVPLAAGLRSISSIVAAGLTSAG